MTDRNQQLANNLARVQQRIDTAAQSRQDRANPPALIAVSKTRPAEEILALYHCGVRQFGENYLQESLQKIDQLEHLQDIQWHFIGHLQSNKSRSVAEKFDWLHTLDSLKLAKRLNDQRTQMNKPPLNILIQINIDGELSKSGLMPEALWPLVDALQPLSHLALRGLMAIPAKPASDTPSPGKPTAFERMGQLFEQLQQYKPKPNPNNDLNAKTIKTEGYPSQWCIDTLSMGMSADLELAVAQGATAIRIGTDLFGPREP